MLACAYVCLCVVAIQCLSRCRKAKALLKAHNAAAKDVGKLQLNNDALKQEIEELRARAKDETRRVLAETEKRCVYTAFNACSCCCSVILHPCNIILYTCVRLIL